MSPEFHKLRWQDFKDFWFPTLCLQDYYVSLRSIVDIWLTPYPFHVYADEYHSYDTLGSPYISCHSQIWPPSTNDAPRVPYTSQVPISPKYHTLWLPLGSHTLPLVYERPLSYIGTTREALPTCPKGVPKLEGGVINDITSWNGVCYCLFDLSSIHIISCTNYLKHPT